MHWTTHYKHLQLIFLSVVSLEDTEIKCDRDVEKPMKSPHKSENFSEFDETTAVESQCKLGDENKYKTAAVAGGYLSG